MTAVRFTANRLGSGAVVWLTQDLDWSVDAAESWSFTHEEVARARAFVDRSQTRNEVIAHYEVPSDEGARYRRVNIFARTGVRPSHRLPISHRPLTSHHPGSLPAMAMMCLTVNLSGCGRHSSAIRWNDGCGASSVKRHSSRCVCRMVSIFSCMPI